MAISVTAFTSAPTIGTTEWSMTTNTAGPDVDTTVGCFQPVLDLNALASADVFKFQVYEKARAADTQRLLFSAVFGPVPTGTPLWMGPAMTLGAGWDMTLVKVSGTDRAIPNSIRAVTA